MTSPKLLVPVRVPELGPSLGKLLTGTGRVPDPVVERERLALVSRLIEASGEARRLAAEEKRGAAVGALGLPVWLDAWERAVSAIARSLIERVNAELDAEARAVRMPRRLRRKAVLDAAEVRGLTGRLGAAGADLVPALDALHASGERLLAATAADRAPLEEWQQALLKAARRLEAAWLALEEQLDAEAGRWRAVAAAVAAWRRPRWPVAAVGVPALAAAAWLGLVLGGYIPAPWWLAELWARLP
jgi:hypothetical protein